METREVKEEIPDKTEMEIETEEEESYPEPVPLQRQDAMFSYSAPENSKKRRATYERDLDEMESRTYTKYKNSYGLPDHCRQNENYSAYIWL